MPDQCPKCGTSMETGQSACPACVPVSDVHVSDVHVSDVHASDAPARIVPPQKAAVIAAFLLPIIATVIFLAIAMGIIVAGALMVRSMNRRAASATAPVSVIPDALQVSPVVAPQPVTTAVALPSSPVTAPISTPPVVASVPPIPQTVVIPNTPSVPAPELTDIEPTIAPPGTKLILRGDGLAAVYRVLLISRHGADTVQAKIVYARDNQVIVTVPEVPFANDGIFIAAFSPGGVAVLIDQHTGATPWGTDGHLQNEAVTAKEGDEIDTLDHMVLLGQPGSSVSVGDDSIAFLGSNVSLKAHGKHCHIYYVAPLHLSFGVSRSGLTEVPSIAVQSGGDEFRVKPDADQ